MSRQLVENFRSAHATILSSIDQILMVCRSYPQAKPLLRALHEKVLSHLGRQDKELMDKLIVAFGDNRETAKLVEFLGHNLKDIKIKFLIFCDKHSGELADVSARSFPKDFQDFSEEMITRIKLEEEYLFPLLLELT